MIAIPILGAITEGAGTVIEKRILRKKKVDYKFYNVASFFMISIIAGILILALGKVFPNLFGFFISNKAWTITNISVLIGVIIFSILANLFTFYALKWEKITELEPIRLMQPLFTILLAFFIFSSEQKTPTPILIAALIASLALILSHVKKHHFSLNKYSLSALFGSLCFAIELVLSNFILNLYSPITFYLIRCFLIFAITLPLFRTNPNTIDKKTWFQIIVVSMLWISYRILLYIGFEKIGVITTTLFLSLLAPLFIYLFSYTFLKEKLNWRNIIAAIVILACVIWAMLA